jgi:hypothetical protein
MDKAVKAGHRNQKAVHTRPKSGQNRRKNWTARCNARQRRYGREEMSNRVPKSTTREPKVWVLILGHLFIAGCVAVALIALIPRVLLWLAGDT